MFFHARNMNHSVDSNYIVVILILRLQGSNTFTLGVVGVVEGPTMVWATIGRSRVTRKVVCAHVVAVFQIVHALFHFQILIGENKKNKKNHVGKMGFPHLPRPPAPSLELWVQTFSCQKRPCGLWRFFFICQASTWSPFSENSHKSGVEPETPHLTEFDRR